MTASTAAGFVPTLNDFENHQEMLTEYPPFPARLLMQNFSSSSSVKRRVRPIAVPPPPGFSNAPQSTSSLSSVPSEASLNYYAQEKPFKSSNTYINQVKMSAIAGALAGDWSVNRSLPDIPSFLLTHLLLHFDITSTSALDLLNSQDLASFCLQHNIHSNITSPVFDQPSSTANKANGFDIMNDALNRVAASTTSAPVATSRPTPQKRRLAPTQITTEALFNVNQFASHANIIQEPIPLVSSFHKTPRAPKDVKEPSVVRQREFGVFPTASTHVEFSTDFTDIPSASPSVEAAVLVDADTIAGLARPKIPPPQPSSPAHRRSQREKQLAIGKNTVEYQNYISLVAPSSRRRGDPVTPDLEQEISKRNWEGQVRKWRRMLHEFDMPEMVPGNGDEAIALDYDGNENKENQDVQIHQPIPVAVKPLNIETADEESFIAHAE